MKTSIKFDLLKGMPKEQQLKALAAAISFEMKKPVLAVELAKSAAIGNLRTDSMAVNAPSFERIKGFLGMKYDTPSDTPELSDQANEFEQFFHTNMPEMDLAFTMLFDMVDLRSSVHESFSIIDTNAGVTFTQREPGEAVKVRKNISESKTTVTMLEFADALGILDRWIERQMFWNIDEAVAEFRAKYFDKMASLHYALLTAQGAGIDQAFDTDDVTTINNAAAAIIRATKEKGYAVGENPTFYLVCSPEKVGRMEKVLTAQRGSAIVEQGTVSQPLVHRIAGIIGTTHVAANDTGSYLVLPGRKIKRGVWKDLTIEDTRNAYTSATDLVGVGQFNAAIGDTSQIKRCKYA